MAWISASQNGTTQSINYSWGAPEAYTYIVVKVTRNGSNVYVRYNQANAGTGETGLNWTPPSYDTYVFEIDIWVNGQEQIDTSTVVMQRPVQPDVTDFSIFQQGFGNTVSYSFSCTVSGTYYTIDDENYNNRVSSSFSSTYASGTINNVSYGSHTFYLYVNMNGTQYGPYSCSFVVVQPSITSFTVSQVDTSNTVQYSFTCNTSGTYYTIDDENNVNLVSSSLSSSSGSGTINNVSYGTHTFSLYVNMEGVAYGPKKCTFSVVSPGAQAYIYATKGGVTKWWPATVYIYDSGWQPTTPKIYSGGWN